MWDVHNPWPNYNGGFTTETAVEVRAWMDNFIPSFHGHVIVITIYAISILVWLVYVSKRGPTWVGLSPRPGHIVACGETVRHPPGRSVVTTITRRHHEQANLSPPTPSVIDGKIATIENPDWAEHSTVGRQMGTRITTVTILRVRTHCASPRPVVAMGRLMPQQWAISQCY